MDNKKTSGKNFSRRQFLKASGAASAVLGSAGLGFFGYQAGKDPESYTGQENFEGANQTFNRKRFAKDQPTYRKTGPTSRPDARTEVIFYRRGTFMQQWKDETGIKSLEPLLQKFYEKHRNKISDIQLLILEQ